MSEIRWVAMRTEALGIMVGKDRAQDIIPEPPIYAANGLIQNVQLCIPAHDQNELYHFFLGAPWTWFSAGHLQKCAALPHFRGVCG